MSDTSKETLTGIQKRLSKLWVRDENTVDLFLDFEFWDRGSAGCHVISGGFVAVAGNQDTPSKYKQATLYAINTGFFDSLGSGRRGTFTHITDLYADGNENAKWMHENVFPHILVEVCDSESGSAGSRFVTAAELQDLIGRDEASEEDDDSADNYALDKYRVALTTKTEAGMVPHFSGSLSEIRNMLDATIASLGVKDPKVRVWAYYNAHDHVCLASLFGAMVDMPENWNFFDYDLRALSDVFGYEHDEFNPEPSKPHHPLYDAHAQYETTQALYLRLQHDGVVIRPSNYTF